MTTIVKLGFGPFDGDSADGTVDLSQNVVTHTTFGMKTIWNGEPIQPLYGGTGITEYTAGDMLYAKNDKELQKLPLGTVGQVLQVGNTNNVLSPKWIDLEFTNIKIGLPVTAYPYENVTAVGGVTAWPNRNKVNGALLKLGYGTETQPKEITVDSSPGTIFVQNWIKPNFTDDGYAQYSSGGIIDTIITGGIGGTTGFDVYITKKGIESDYTGRVSAIGLRSIADGRPSEHYNGILTGLWAGVYSHKSDAATDIAVGQEINSFTSFSWDPSVDYANDVFSYVKHCVVGLLINNYQQGVSDYSGASGDYQNAFGIALTSYGPGGTNGRGFGYQTGIYLTECSQEAIRIRGGVFGDNDKKTKYGIKFEGTSFSESAISLNNNKINLGSYTESLTNNGDMSYNTTNSVLSFKDADGVKEILKSGPGVISSGIRMVTNVTESVDHVDPTTGFQTYRYSKADTAIKKVKVKIGGIDYYILATTDPS